MRLEGGMGSPGQCPLLIRARLTSAQSPGQPGPLSGPRRVPPAANRSRPPPPPSLSPARMPVTTRRHGTAWASAFRPAKPVWPLLPAPTPQRWAGLGCPEHPPRGTPGAGLQVPESPALPVGGARGSPSPSCLGGDRNFQILALGGWGGDRGGQARRPRPAARCLGPPTPRSWTAPCAGCHATGRSGPTAGRGN